MKYLRALHNRSEIDIVRSYAASALFTRRQPMARFAIFGPGRTGSNLLVDLLDRHPSIRCEAELLRATRLYPRRYLRGRAVLAGAGRTYPAWGFKLIDTHLRMWQNHVGAEGQLLDHLVADGFSVVFLTRRDALAQSLSMVHAFHHNSWQFGVDDECWFEPFVVDPAEVVSTMHVLDEHERWARTVVQRVPHLALVYEDDLIDAARQQKTVDRICDELGLGHHPVAAGLRRGAPSDVRDRVVNHGELAELLETTRFAEYAAGLRDA